MTMSDRVVVMFGGRIAQIGEPADIYERPENLDVAQFVGQVNLIPGKIAAKTAAEATISTMFGNVPVATRAGHDVGASVTLSLLPESIELAAAGSQGVPGRIVSRYYSGSLVDFRVALDPDLILHVQSFPSVRFVEGDAVAVRVPLDRLWLVGAAK
jgi:putative spermidine/putrescine transport system ATP-binding protein